MPRPPQTPRLQTLDPVRTAADVCAALLAQIGSLAEALRPVDVRAAVSSPTLLAEATRVGQAVQRLVRYAQGQSVEGDPVAEVERLLGVDAASERLETPLGVALAAATARRQLSRGEPVTVRELAALGGVDPNALRLQVRAAKVAATGRGEALSFEPKEALKWLESRGSKEK